ncbi:MAG: phenylalanine--tRNA ligase subunit beta [Crocinitomicaceae bacterium]
MKVAYNWLKQYIDTEISPNEISSILTDTGLEVESLEKIEAIKGGLEGVVIGEVLTCEPHPDADKLKITSVNIGKDEPLQIVCGAPNVAEGQKVIVATVGCTLYPNPEEPFKIKRAKIRGIESSGMLCAEDELGLGESHEGIMVLDEAVEVGTNASEYFGLESDYIFEIGLTPNRADAMGHIGVVRDLIAYLNVHKNKGLVIKTENLDDFKKDNNNLKIQIDNQNEEDCLRYLGVTLTNVSITESPSWLKNRLLSIGLKPINNVVDITNYVMHELGTPLHAFDAEMIGEAVVIRSARPGEKIITLDGIERSLTSNNLVISNGEDSLCIAGVLGDENSGVKSTTKNIFLESAYFNPVSIRKTAKQHGLNTDASFRFERGVDPSLTDYALKRAALLIKEIAGGEISMDIVESYPTKIENHSIVFHYDKCTQLIGVEIPKDQINEILENLDIKILSDINGTAKLEVPAYRVDVTREADIIEEVLRIFGFNNVPLPKKLNTSIHNFPKPDLEKIQSTISELLVGKGYYEMLNNSLTNAQYSQKFKSKRIDASKNVELLNPLSQELSVMRQSLIFNMLEVIRHNQNRQNADLKLFEFGKTYSYINQKYIEEKKLIIAVTGKLEQEQWNNSPKTATFYTIKGLVNSILQRLGLSNLLKENALVDGILADGVSLNIIKKSIGEMGWISNEMKKHFGIKNDVFIAELNYDTLIESLTFTKTKYTELPKTFAVRRDFSLLIDNKITFGEIEGLAKKANKNLLKEVGLFDVYQGDKLPEGKKSYAVSFFFQDEEQTLKDEQIDSIMSEIRDSLEKKLNAELR